MTEKYNYANKIIKIFGFQNIVDYTNILSYTKLKNNTQYVCNAVNETMEEFKKLFNLKKFDLARINYNFTTISQIYSFLKKLLTELSIPFETFKKKQQTFLRLIQTNNLYIDNIINMAENGTKTNFDFQQFIEKVYETQPNIKITELNNEVKLSKIVKTYGKKPITKEILFTNNLLLNDINNIFDCITEIDIKPHNQDDDFKNYIVKIDSPQDKNIQIFKKSIEKNNKNCLIDNILLPISLTTLTQLVLNLYKKIPSEKTVIFIAKITGIKFKSILPKTLFDDKIHIDLLNTTNQYLENYKFYLSKGCINYEYNYDKFVQNNKKKYINGESESNEPNELEYYKKNNKITEKIINLYNENILIIKIDNDTQNLKTINNNNNINIKNDMLRYLVFLGSNTDNFTKLNLGTNILSNKIKKENFGIEYNSTAWLKTNFSIINNNNVILYYSLSNNNDLITKIKILNNFTNDYNVKLTINYHDKNIYEKNFSINETLNFEFDKPITLVNKSSNIFLTIEIPIKYYDKWLHVNYEYSSVILDTKIRLLVSQLEN